jgi:hypothetical protein
MLLTKQIEFENTALNLLENEKYQDFDQLLQNNSESNQNLRLISHLKAKKFIYQENYKKALLQLKLTSETYGQYIGVQLDILACYYCTQNYFHLEEEVLKIDRELQHFAKKLTPSNLARTYLFLGKLFEELCYLSKAYEYYQLALKFHSQIDQKIKALAQLLRFCSLYKKSEVSFYFDNLTRINSELITKNLFIEVEHAKALAFFELLSFESSLQNLKDLMQNKFGRTDQALIYFDSLEIVKRKNNALEIQALQEMAIEATTDFEEALLKNQTNLKQLNTLNKAEKLRLLYHLADKTHYYLLLNSLTTNDLKLWQSAFPLKSVCSKLIFSKDTLTINDKPLDLSNKSATQDLLKLFCHHKQVMLNEQNYNQYRVATARLNRLVQNTLGVGPIISLKGRELILIVEIEFA